jgi:hypothetical protein
MTSVGRLTSGDAARSDPEHNPSAKVPTIRGEPHVEGCRFLSRSRRSRETPDKEVCKLSQENPYPFNNIAESFDLHRVWHCKCPKACKGLERRFKLRFLWGDTMRSELVFGAMAHVPNRFLLTKLAATATRKFHRPHARIQETVTEVLHCFNHVSPIPRAQESSNVQLFRQVERTHQRRINQSQAVA